VPIPLLEKTEAKLNAMVEEQLIRRIESATEWCAPLVVVPKRDGDVRICVDYSELNEYVIRPRQQQPAVDECLTRHGNDTVSSVLDAKQGFWQVPLHKDSQEITFLTPFGRFCWNRLPMGLSSSGEFHQRQMQLLLAGIPGVVSYLDDVLVSGSTVEEHDKCLRTVLERLFEGGILLNKQKCQIRKDEVRFLENLIGRRGISTDPEKVSAILNLPAPTDVTGMRSALGMVNQLIKFMPQLSSVTQLLRELTVLGNEWTWGPPQEEAFNKIKAMLTSTPCLASFDPKKPTRVSADSSSFGLGALIEQQLNQDWRLVAYASRTLSPTESRYDQVEKEALASTWRKIRRIPGRPPELRVADG